MATGEVANLIVALKLDDAQFSGKLSRVQGQLSGLSGGLSNIGRGAGQVASGIDRIATRAALAAAGGLAAVVTTAVSFEDAFAGVRKTVDASEERLDSLNDTFRQMAREIPLSFEELAGIGEQAGALGIAVEAIDEFTRVAALIGVTTDVSSQQAATSLGVLSTVLHLTEADYDNFGATLVDLGNKGASTESAILALAERAGAGASLVGIAADQTLGWASALANLGIEVEAGGTSLQKFFVESLQLIQDDDTLNVFAETAGTTAAAFKQAFEEDASGALETFIIGLGKLGEAERLAVLEALGFNDIRITRALLGLAGDTSNLTESLDIASQAWQENTALTVEAEKRFATTRSQLTLLKNNVRDAAATIGMELLPVINEMVKEFVTFINLPTTQAGLQQFAEDLAGGIRSLVSELRGTDFSGIIAGIKLAAEVSKGAFDAFRSLPAPIQQLAIAALIANKATGGAVGDIASGLVKIVAGIFGLRGSSPLNPMWVQNVGGVGAAGGPPAGGPTAGGGIGGVLAGFLGTAAILTTISGGLLAIEKIVSGNADLNEEAVRQGVGAAMTGFPGMIGLAVSEALKGLLPDIFGGPSGGAVPGQPFPKTGESGPFVPTFAGTREGGGGNVVLPDTAMSALTTTSTGVAKLPPILTAQERQAAQTRQLLGNLTAITNANASRHLSGIGASTAAIREGDRFISQNIINTQAAIRDGNTRLLAKPTSFTLNATVQVTASSVVTQTNLYTSIRGGVQEY